VKEVCDCEGAVTVTELCERAVNVKELMAIKAASRRRQGGVKAASRQRLRRLDSGVGSDCGVKAVTALRPP
jgi:hypothetical protein